MSDKKPKLVLEKHHSKWIYYLGWLSCFNSMIGFTNGYYDTGLMIFAGFLTCINYWRHPILGLRRNIDITMVSLATSYSTYTASFCPNSHIYQIIALIATLSYFIGVIFYNKNYIGISTLLHCHAHIWLNICNYLLFTHQICF
jgi:hypothetical protein